MEKELCYKIGYVSKTHGLKGEVTAIFSEPVELDEIDSVFIEVKNNLVPHFIKDFSDRGDKTFIQFEDVDTTEKAIALKGCSVYLPKDVRPKLKRGEFYNDEIIGFDVEDQTVGLLGKITAVSATGPNRLLTVAYKNKEILIPVNSPFILSSNKTKKIVRVDLPEGFLDI